jgi:hypothetical protein
MCIRIHRIDAINNKISWYLSETTVSDSKNWRQLSLSNAITELKPGTYFFLLTIDEIPQFAQIDFLIGSTNPDQKYYRFNPVNDGSFRSEPMHFKIPTMLKVYIYYKVLKIPHIKLNPSEQTEETVQMVKKIPHIASRLISGNIIIFNN